jgi:16S rRNA (guanine527-N7)-methyltransferase
VASRDLRTRLGKRAFKANLFIAAELSDRLIAYYELLSRWNRKINLTALEDPDQAIDRLLLEPVLAARHLPGSNRSPIRQMDVGSGGGSPAIPMRLITPHMRLMMVEVKARKAAFLREAVRQLDLVDTQVETARYEELLARPELHEAFDAVSVRAVRLEARVLTSLQAFLAPGGSIMLFRGPSGPAEPAMVVPPLQWAGTYPLIDSLQSRLTILTKRDVPRGTAVREHRQASPS